MKNQFEVKNRSEYIYLRTWGNLESDGLETPAEAALAISRETGINKLLDNIQEVNPTVKLSVQLKGVKVLWKLRAFKKIAVVVKENELGTMFFSSISVLHLSDAVFRGFTTEEDAIAWLKSGT